MPNPQPPTLLTHDWSMGYPMTLRSVRLARLQARRRLTMWQWAGDIDDAVLVVSELVANAVRHGRVVGHELWLRLAELEDRGLVVEVSDPVRAFPEITAEPEPEGESGRGFSSCVSSPGSSAGSIAPTSARPYGPGSPHPRHHVQAVSWRRPP